MEIAFPDNGGWAFDFGTMPSMNTLPSALPVSLDDIDSFGESAQDDGNASGQSADAVKCDLPLFYAPFSEPLPDASTATHSSSSDHESEMESHASARAAVVGEAEPAETDKVAFEPVVFASAPAPAPAEKKSSAQQAAAVQEKPEPRKKRVRAAAVKKRIVYSAPSSGDDEGTPTCKRERNKQSAAKYRKRRKMYVVELEAKVAQLESRVQEQTSALSGLETENKAMKDQVTFLKKMLNIRNELPAMLPTAKKGAILFALFSFFVITFPLWELRDAPVPTDAHYAAAPLPVRYSNGRALLSLDDQDFECTVTPKSAHLAPSLRAGGVNQTSPAPWGHSRPHPVAELAARFENVAISVAV